MKYRRLGRSDMNVSAVCLGCWAFAGDFAWGRQDVQDSIAAVHASLEAGVNFFDTAEAYGDGSSERVLAKALGTRRKDVFIASKVSETHLEPDRLRACCEASLRRLGSDYIDLYQLHFPSKTIPIDETFAAMDDLRRQGKVRAVGVCNFGTSFLDILPAGPRVESNQVAFSLLWRAVEYGILPRCRKLGISILAYSPLFQGLLTGKFGRIEDVPEGRSRNRLFRPDRKHARHQETGCEAELFEAIDGIRRLCEGLGQPMGHVALAWLFAQEGLTSAIVGARNAEQARANAAATGLELSADVLAQLERITDSIKQYVGPNADMWQTDSRLDK